MEDIHPDSGPISIAVDRHRMQYLALKCLTFQHLKMKRSLKAYTIYEEWLKQHIDSQNLEIVTPELKKEVDLAIKYITWTYSIKTEVYRGEVLPCIFTMKM